MVALAWLGKPGHRPGTFLSLLPYFIEKGEEPINPMQLIALKSLMYSKK
jgi:hypothetical protein